MKAGQLARILQSVEPESEVYFSLGDDKTYRRNLLDSVGNNPEITSYLQATRVEVSDKSDHEVRTDVYLYPQGEYLHSLIKEAKYGRE